MYYIFVRVTVHSILDDFTEIDVLSVNKNKVSSIPFLDIFNFILNRFFPVKYYYIPCSISNIDP